MRHFYQFLILCFFLSKAYSFTGDVNIKRSLVDWHLLIKSDTHVYGNIKLTSGRLDTVNKNGEFVFDLGETKSWELDDDKKEYSNARDERIYDITGAQKSAPKFIISDIENLREDQRKEKSSSTKKLKISGKLTLNGVEKRITLDASLDEARKHLRAHYKLDWRDFKIANPVIWILRLTKKPEDKIDLDFNIFFN